MDITQEEYTKRLKNIDEKTKEVILSIESNPAIFALAEAYDLDQDTTYSIANKINLQLLGFIKSKDVIEYVSTSTTIDGEEFKTIYPRLLDNVLKKSPQPLFKKGEENLNLVEKFNNENTEKTDSTHISHHDILSEIENPTPSLDTTTDFQNASSVTNIVNTTSTGNVTQPTTSTNAIKTSNTTSSNISPTSTEPSLHSPTPTALYTNPALHIATKLGQNLSTPSASIPKDIYISKKPDPYHEPVQ